jgi:hypothetical protein
LTDEHVISLWISEDLKAIVLAARPDLAGSLRFLHESGEGRFAPFEADAANAVAKVVCDQCNPGWMNDLEGEMQEILPRMFRGYKTRLSMRRQQLVASWAAMKFMVGEFLAPRTDPKFFSQEQREAFKETLQPPHGVFLWLGVDIGQKAAWSAGRHLDWPDGGYVGVYAAGGLLILMVARRVATLAVPAFLTDYVVPLWPFERLVKWPPGGQFDDESIFHFFANVPMLPPELVPQPAEILGWKHQPKPDGDQAK